MRRRKFVKSVIGAGLLGSTMNAFAFISNLSNELYHTGKKKMPILFIGHGSPMNGIENNEFSKYWNKLGKEIPKPQAVLCISAHWLTKGTAITAMKKPRTIHDFGDFSHELSNVQYNVDGSPVLAEEIKRNMLNIKMKLDHDWGLDHGCWTVVKQMYPDEDIPVLQLSIDIKQSGEYHYNLGKQLDFLRKKGVLIIGSGNMIHNLSMIGAPKGKQVSLKTMSQEYGYDWALDINETFKNHIMAKNHKAMIDYKKMGAAAVKAIPQPDHYYPLLYILGLQSKSDQIEVFNDKCVGGSLSMTSFLIK